MEKIDRSLSDEPELAEAVKEHKSKTDEKS
jgi:hypothetical protein